jgi:hypothetical protein
MYGSTKQCPTDSFSSTFIHCSGHIVLTRCSIDLFLFPLHSQLRRDHFYAIGRCVHHLVAGFWHWGLNMGHRPVPEKNLIRLPLTPPPSSRLPRSYLPMTTILRGMRWHGLLHGLILFLVGGPSSSGRSGRAVFDMGSMVP